MSTKTVWTTRFKDQTQQVPIMSTKTMLPAALTLLWIVVFIVAYQPLKQSLVMAGLTLTLTMVLLFGIFFVGLLLLGRWTWWQSSRSVSR